MSSSAPWATDSWATDEPVAGVVSGRKRVSTQSSRDGQLPIGRETSASRAGSTPWASDYEVPETKDTRNSGRTSNSREGRSSARGTPNSTSAGGENIPRAVRAGESFLGDAPPRAAPGGSLQGQSTVDSDGDWKRPRTLAPPWAAGGGQEMLLSSPAQGRKVSFVLGKPTYYNVEDAPSAVPTSKSERSWTSAESRSRPITPAAPPVLKLPAGAVSLRPRTPAAPSLSRPGTGSSALQQSPSARQSTAFDAYPGQLQDTGGGEFLGESAGASVQDSSRRPDSRDTSHAKGGDFAGLYPSTGLMTDSEGHGGGGWRGCHALWEWGWGGLLALQSLGSGILLLLLQLEAITRMGGGRGRVVT
jgi:hypothetical protein